MPEFIIHPIENIVIVSTESILYLFCKRNNYNNIFSYWCFYKVLLHLAWIKRCTRYMVNTFYLRGYFFYGHTVETKNGKIHCYKWITWKAVLIFSQKVFQQPYLYTSECHGCGVESASFHQYYYGPSNIHLEIFQEFGQHDV